IRAGNTLVGFATYAEVQKTVSQKTVKGVTQAGLGYDDPLMREIDEKAEIAARAFEKFRAMQTEYGMDAGDFHTAKEELRHRLDALGRELDHYLAGEYGVDAQKPKDFEQWRASHQPFHWFVEFYEIIKRGGFDVIIGNPPYVEINARNITYKIPQTYTTLECGNLYAVVTERCNALINNKGRFSFIIPSASCCTPRMSPLLNLLTAKYPKLWVSIYDERPGKLFNGVDQQLCIHVGFSEKTGNELNVTPMRHWLTSPADERKHLFETLNFVTLKSRERVAEVPPKIGSLAEAKLLDKLLSVKSTTLANLSTASRSKPIYYRNAGGRYWRLVKSFPSYFKSESGRRASTTEYRFSVRNDAVPVVVGLYSSTLFYWFWRTVSNCRHLTNREFETFPIALSLFDETTRTKLTELSTAYESKLKTTAVRRTTQNSSSGRVIQDEYYVNTAKPIIDEIDRVLAKHYGFTDEELDFIINYDIKYRMGSAEASGNGDE
ncbi:MAG: Eco57I restriction-modification methylase domain-containing protein, partial [Acidobacteria bacterium]|nr:Eco57I restriction-modification methylase domain-containing protein [Acidobacteriota bacterium]